MANETAQPYPSTSIADLLRLAGAMVSTLVRRPRSFDTSLLLREWVKGVSARRNSENLVINLFFRKLLLVTSQDLSEHILEQAPSSNSYMEGPTKASAMSFLAEQALTICHDQQWRRLRPYNEQVLALQEDLQRQQVFLQQVQQTFSGPVTSLDDIRSCMGRAMLRVVFGEGKAPTYLVEDIQVLFGYVQSPVRRIVLGRTQKRRRDRFYGALRQLWRETGESQQVSLLATARRLAAEDGYDEEELLQQIPHWMFTFTGSGTDLLFRTLAVVAARPQVRAKVEAEISEKGTPDQASTIEGLEYLEACLLETCRLFPPVVRTLYVAPQGDVFGGKTVPAGMEILHYFTAHQRDTASDASANDFRPERWLGPGADAPSLYPNLFLSGARACPGRDLVLFICKAAIAMLLKERNLQVEAASLAADPLPLTFPEREVRFRA